jgi:hypothetical protein
MVGSFKTVCIILALKYLESIFIVKHIVSNDKPSHFLCSLCAFFSPSHVYTDLQFHCLCDPIICKVFSAEEWY